MARLFVDTSSQYMHTGSPGVTAYPFSVSAWFNSDDAGLDQAIWFGGDKDVNFLWHGLLWLNGTTNKLQAYVKDGGGTSNAASTTTWGANAWNHAMGRWASTTSRKVNLNGDTAVENTTSRAPSAWDRMAIGALADSTVDGYMSGSIGSVAIWDVVLSDDEVAALALGVDPRRIRPGSLIHYWRIEGLDSPEPDWTSNGASLTLVGTPARANNPPVELFTPPWAASVPLIEVAAGGGFGHSQAVIIS